MGYKIELNENELQILDEALSQLPYFKVVGLIQKINEQLGEQQENDEG